jgi:hypothetical protein
MEMVRVRHRNTACMNLNHFPSFLLHDAVRHVSAVWDHQHHHLMNCPSYLYIFF